LCSVEDPFIDPNLINSEPNLFILPDLNSYYKELQDRISFIFNKELFLELPFYELNVSQIKIIMSDEPLLGFLRIKLCSITLQPLDFEKIDVEYRLKHVMCDLRTCYHCRYVYYTNAIRSWGQTAYFPIDILTDHSKTCGNPQKCNFCSMLITYGWTFS